MSTFYIQATFQCENKKSFPPNMGKSFASRKFDLKVYAAVNYRSLWWFCFGDATLTLTET